MQWEQFPDAEAFLKSDTHAFDIVFMDIDMPGRNGIEASWALRERNQSIVLLFVTNLAQYAIAGYEVDALDYILKPINYFSFKLKIQKALETVRRVQGTLLTIASDHGQQLVRDSEILYIEVQGRNLIPYVAWRFDSNGDPEANRSAVKTKRLLQVQLLLPCQFASCRLFGWQRGNSRAV